MLTPPACALERLGLDATAGERDVRKAYARALKEQNLEEAPEAFQHLREAYELALAWARICISGVSEAKASAESNGASGGDNLASAAEPLTFQAKPLSPGSPSSTCPVSPRSGEREGDAVFEEFLATLETLSFYPGPAFIQQRLGQCWSDPRLVSIAAREHFEFRFANLLVDEFCPFEKVLVPVAVNFFDWTRDRKRLDCFGEAGRALNFLIDRYGFHQLHISPANVSPRPIPPPPDSTQVFKSISRLAWQVGFGVHGFKEGFILPLSVLVLTLYRPHASSGGFAHSLGIRILSLVGLSVSFFLLGAMVGRWFCLRAARNAFRNWALYALGNLVVLSVICIALDSFVHAGLLALGSDVYVDFWEALIPNFDPAWFQIPVTMGIASLLHLYLFKEHSTA